MSAHKIVTIGDPHLGHKFRVGVSHEMIGKREGVVNKTFEDQLNEAGKQGADLCVCMGDLFDTHTVDNDLVHEVYRYYVRASTKYPDTVYVLLKGNHDWHRDHTRVASFDILYELLQDIDNVVVTLSPTLLFKGSKIYGLFPWMPPEPHTALEWAQKICEGKKIEAAFGHWDSAWSEHNIIPTDYLISQGIKSIYTGHEHTPRVVEEHGTKIVWTGSMMPYAHGQDPNHTLYRTLTLEEYMDLDEDEFHPYCYKVVLQSQEVLPYLLRAWEVRISHQLASDEESLEEQVGYEAELDIPTMWASILENIPESVRDDVGFMYKEHMQ